MEFKLQSGERLTVSPASFYDANALRKALLKSIKGLDIAKSILETDIKSFFDGLIAAATSDEVESAMFKCGERALYGEGNVKVNPSLFDDPGIGEKAREDYFEIFKCIAEVNCLPFFKRVSFGLSQLLPKKTE